MPDLPTSALQRFANLEPLPQPPIIPLRYPVLLMHGFGILASVRRGGHMHELAMNLRHHGVHAYAPNVAPYNTVAARSEMWLRRIDHMLEETGAPRFTIVAHSMGGLDARYLISKRGLHDRVEAVVTISTPHRGTPIATLALNQPDMVREWLANMADWVGTRALEDTPSDAMQAVKELTPAFMRDTFNPEVPNHPSVRYWSYAGRAGKGTDVPLDPFFYMLNTYLYKREGLNDGYISVDSAKWGDFLGTIDADHARQVGLNSNLGADFDANAFYTSIIRMLYDQGY